MCNLQCALLLDSNSRDLLSFERRYFSFCVCLLFMMVRWILIQKNYDRFFCIFLVNSFFKSWSSCNVVVSDSKTAFCVFERFSLIICFCFVIFAFFSFVVSIGYLLFVWCDYKIVSVVFKRQWWSTIVCLFPKLSLIISFSMMVAQSRE